MPGVNISEKNTSVSHSPLFQFTLKPFLARFHISPALLCSAPHLSLFIPNISLYMHNFLYSSLHLSPSVCGSGGWGASSCAKQESV